VSDGTRQITTTFNTNSDLDIAAVDVPNRVSTASGQLPAEVNSTGITITKANSNFVFAAGFYSEHGEYSNLFISNYLDVYVKDALKRIKTEGLSRKLVGVDLERLLLKIERLLKRSTAA